MRGHDWFWLHPVIICLIIAAVAYAMFNFGSVKRLVVGKPMRTRDLRESRNLLVWWMALPVLRQTCIRRSHTDRRRVSPSSLASGKMRNG